VDSQAGCTGLPHRSPAAPRARARCGRRTVRQAGAPGLAVHLKEMPLSLSQ